MINKTNKFPLYPLHKGDSLLEVYILHFMHPFSYCKHLPFFPEIVREIASRMKYEVFRDSREKSKN